MLLISCVYCFFSTLTPTRNDPGGHGFPSLLFTDMIHLEWCSVHVGPQQKLVERMNEGRKCDNLGRGLQSKKALEPRKGGLLAWLGVVDISAVLVPWAVLLLRVTLPLFAFGIICSPHQSTWISWADSTPHSQGGRDSAGHTDWFRARTYFTGWVNETEV